MQITDFLKLAKINRGSYYGGYFREIWKPRIAKAFGVNEEEFFKGYDEEIHSCEPLVPQIGYSDSKISTIEKLEKGWVSIQEIRQTTGMNCKQATALISNIKYRYEVEVRTIDGQTQKKEYHITGEIDKSNFKIFVPINRIPKKINKMDLITWNLDSSQLKFASSHELVQYAKSKGKEVYEINDDGGYKYL